MRHHFILLFVILHLLYYALTGTMGLIKNAKYILILVNNYKFECLAFGFYKAKIFCRKRLVS